MGERLAAPLVTRLLLAATCSWLRSIVYCWLQLAKVSRGWVIAWRISDRSILPDMNTFLYTKSPSSLPVTIKVGFVGFWFRHSHSSEWVSAYAYPG